MRQRFRRAVASVSVRLWWRMLLAVLAVLTANGLASYAAASRRWTAAIESNALRTSQLIQEATHTGMLTNRKWEVDELIQRISTTPGVASIHIWGNDGRVLFTSDEGVDDHPTALTPTSAPCDSCHGEAAAQPAAYGDQERVRVHLADGGQEQLEIVSPLLNQPSCRTAACHAHADDPPMLGMLDVRMSMDPLDDALAFIGRQQLLTTLALSGVLSLLLFLPLDRLVRRPVRRLVESTRRVAAGDLSVRIPARGSDEMAALARSFNRMTEDLERAHGELTGWSRRLENEVDEKAAELQRAHRQMLHMEKMVSLGKLAATVAHEINNPLSGILTYARLVEREVGPCLQSTNREDVAHFLHFIQQESTRCGDIVRNLLVFARHGGSSMTEAHLDEVVDRSAMLVRHHLEMSHSRLEREDRLEDDRLVCDPGQIEQALVALLINAAEALGAREEEGVLTVRTEGDEHDVRLQISDNGPGIPEDVLPHIFEPFFSTKAKESGVGLGLAVVFGIVQRHQGTIDVDSAPGRGTTFRIVLPRRPAVDDPNEQETRS